MSDYVYFDDDVEIEIMCVHNIDIYEIAFNKPVDAFNIHKDDVIHLAKLFGLTVYEKESAL